MGVKTGGKRRSDNRRKRKAGRELSASCKVKRQWFGEVNTPLQNMLRSR